MEERIAVDPMILPCLSKELKFDLNLSVQVLRAPYQRVHRVRPYPLIDRDPVLK